MSAYQCSRNHIWHLVDAAFGPRFEMVQGMSLSWYWTPPGQLRGELRCGDYQEAARIGQMLADANVESLQARYPENWESMLGWREYGEHERGFGHDHYSAVEMLHACHGYAYQACEHEGWKTSEAHAFLEALEKRLVRALPGYEEAKTWSID